MEKKKSGVSIGNVLGIFLLLFAAVISIYAIWKTTLPILKVSNIFILLSLVSACVYFIAGAKKNAAPYYKGFLIMFASSEFIKIMVAQSVDQVVGEIANQMQGEMPGSAVTFEPTLVLITDVIVFAVLCVLAFATDLGKRKSMILGCVALALSVFCNLNGLIGATMNGGNAVVLTMMSAGSGTLVVLCLALLLMISGKYKDKAARNTK